MATLPNLVHYAGIAKRTVILAEYYHDRSIFPSEWTSVASRCLEHVPPLHNRFSHTTSHRMFICIMEGVFIYFAIVDEALSRAKAFMFLEHVRDAFNIILQQRDGLWESQTPQAFNKDMDPFFHRLASPLVGITQKEKDLIQAEQQEQQQRLLRSSESCTSSSSATTSSLSTTTSMAELFYDEESDTDMDPKSSGRCNQSPHIPLIGKGKTTKKKGKHQMHTNRVTDMNREENCFEITIDDKDQHRSEDCGTYQSGWESAKKLWWNNAKIIIMVDVFVCLILLAVWLVVCDGVQCLK